MPRQDTARRSTENRLRIRQRGENITSQSHQEAPHSQRSEFSFSSVERPHPQTGQSLRPIPRISPPSLPPWDCNICFANNISSSSFCRCCGFPPVRAPRPASSPTPSWHCSICSERNLSASSICRGCGFPPQDLSIENEGTRWDCLVCSHQGNHGSSSHCAACATPRGTPSPWPLSEQPSTSSRSTSQLSAPLHLEPLLPVLVDSSHATAFSWPVLPSIDVTLENYVCVICLNEPRNQIFMPCFHLICCSTCVPNISRGDPCPMCRTTIEDIRQVYL